MGFPCDGFIDVLDVLKRVDSQEHPGYWVRYVELDLSEYSDEQITMEIAPHGFSSMSAIRSIYGQDAIYIYAECIASNQEFDPFTCTQYDDLKSVADALCKERGIRTDWMDTIAG